MSRHNLSEETCDKVLDRYGITTTVSTITINKSTLYTIFRFIYSLGLDRDIMKMKYKE